MAFVILLQLAFMRDGYALFTTSVQSNQRHLDVSERIFVEQRVDTLLCTPSYRLDIYTMLFPVKLLTVEYHSPWMGTPMHSHPASITRGLLDVT